MKISLIGRVKDCLSSFHGPLGKILSDYPPPDKYFLLCPSGSLSVRKVQLFQVRHLEEEQPWWPEGEEQRKALLSPDSYLVQLKRTKGQPREILLTCKNQVSCLHTASSGCKCFQIIHD